MGIQTISKGEDTHKDAPLRGDMVNLLTFR